MNSFIKFLCILYVLTACQGQAQSPSPAIETFEAFWKLFNERYASFEEKKIDWQATYDTYRPQINESTDAQTLFNILSQALRPLNDGHINLRANELDTTFTAIRPSQIIEELRAIPLSEAGPLLRSMIENSLEQAQFKPSQDIGHEENGRKLFTYTDNGQIGYLRFTRCYGGSLSAMENALDEIFASFQNIKALIIDIRFNRGGNDSFSQRVAGRFIDQKILTYYKQTRRNKKFGSLRDIFIEPRGDAPFLKPVVVLTNDRSISAADVFALMMSQLPQVTIIGTPSNGSFSDLYAQQLPNGWTITLSNQRYLSQDKINYEGLGIPVDIEVMNIWKDIQNKEDKVLQRAIEFLKKKDK